jgi:enoyl-CoA hydratase/carnithine racemase
MSEELIHYNIKLRIAEIIIDRPDKAHAFNVDMLKLLYNYLIEADKDEKVKYILIKSTGTRFFSAGYDLKQIQGSPEMVKQVTEWGRKVNETMLFLKKPIITQVQGIAVGFGVLMILASDLRIFADRPIEELYLRLPELAISAFPQTGATLLPLLAFGQSYAKYLLFTADKVGVEDLKNLNFPTRIFPLEDLDANTKTFMRDLVKYKNEFIFTTKTMLSIMNKTYIKSCFDLEDECGTITYANKSYKELSDFIGNLYKKYT